MARVSAPRLEELVREAEVLSTLKASVPHAWKILEHEIGLARLAAAAADRQSQSQGQGQTLTSRHLQSARKRVKLRVPAEQYPDYNFVGRLLGPRGATLKRLERDTGCRIMIRGKGSIRKDKEAEVRGKPGWEHVFHEPLHVVIEVADLPPDDIAAPRLLARAKELVELLLVPIPEERDSLKRQQLRDLAILNGTHRSVTDLLSASVYHPPTPPPPPRQPPPPPPQPSPPREQSQPPTSAQQQPSTFLPDLEKLRIPSLDFDHLSESTLTLHSFGMPAASPTIVDPDIYPYPPTPNLLHHPALDSHLPPTPLSAPFPSPVWSTTPTPRSGLPPRSPPPPVSASPPHAFLRPAEPSPRHPHPPHSGFPLRESGSASPLPSASAPDLSFSLHAPPFNPRDAQPPVGSPTAAHTLLSPFYDAEREAAPFEFRHGPPPLASPRQPFRRAPFSREEGSAPPLASPRAGGSMSGRREEPIRGTTQVRRGRNVNIGAGVEFRRSASQGAEDGFLQGRGQPLREVEREEEQEQQLIGSELLGRDGGGVGNVGSSNTHSRW